MVDKTTIFFRDFGHVSRFVLVSSVQKNWSESADDSGKKPSFPMNIKNPLRIGDLLRKAMSSSLHTSLGRWVSAVRKSESIRGCGAELGSATLKRAKLKCHILSYQALRVTRKRKMGKCWTKGERMWKVRHCASGPHSTSAPGWPWLSPFYFWTPNVLDLYNRESIWENFKM